jgi:nicotinamidase-related amidase
LKKIGFFEVCCREKASAGNGLSFTERSMPFSERLSNLQALARENGGPFVFTTCCAERFLRKGDSADVLLIPLDPADNEWMDGIATHCIYNIEKKPDYDDIAKSDAERLFDMFQHNANADKMFAALGILHWVVYGVGIDLCVSSAVKGLLKAGLRVTLLSDVLTSNAGCSPESMTLMLKQLSEMGAKIQTYAEFLRYFRASSI